MKKKIMMMFFVVILLFFPKEISALNCPYDQLNKLKRIATNIRYDYSYREAEGKAIFQIRLTNLNPVITIKDVYHNNVFSYSNNGEITIDNFPAGGTYLFEMRATNSLGLPSVYYLNEVVNGVLTQIPIEVAQVEECDDISIYNLYVTVPSYNPYYNLEICNNSSSKLCGKWYQHNLSKEKFIEQIKKDNEKKKENVNEQVSNKTLFDILYGWYKQNYIYMWFVTILLATLVVYLYKKQKTGFEGW